MRPRCRTFTCISLGVFSPAQFGNRSSGIRCGPYEAMILPVFPVEQSKEERIALIREAVDAKRYSATELEAEVSALCAGLGQSLWLGRLSLEDNICRALAEPLRPIVCYTLRPATGQPFVYGLLADLLEANDNPFAVWHSASAKHRMVGSPSAILSMCQCFRPCARRSSVGAGAKVEPVQEQLLPGENDVIVRESVCPFRAP